MYGLEEGTILRAIIIGLGVVFILWAIVIIVNLIITYRKESKNTEKLIKEKQNNSMKENNLNGAFMQQVNMDNNIQSNSNMQMAYAQIDSGVFTQFEPEGMSEFNEGIEQNNNGFYATSMHFTDTGRSALKGDYTNGSFKTFSDRNFVIIKSVICTETREEID